MTLNHWFFCEDRAVPEISVESPLGFVDTGGKEETSLYALTNGRSSFLLFLFVESCRGRIQVLRNLLVLGS